MKVVLRNKKTTRKPRRCAKCNGLLMTVGGFGNPHKCRVKSVKKNSGEKQTKLKEYTVPLSRVEMTPLLKRAIARYTKFHGSPPTRLRVFKYSNGSKEEIKHTCFKLGDAEIKINVAQTPDGRDVRIKPLEIGDVYTVKGGIKSNKAGQQWIHSHREGGGKPPINVVDVVTGVRSRLGGTCKVTDWMRR